MLLGSGTALASMIVWMAARSALRSVKPLESKKLAWATIQFVPTSVVSFVKSLWTNSGAPESPPCSNDS